jgi:THO complex subunit 4
VDKLEMVYDRAGRSEGTCFVTYHRESDAAAAIRDYDGATAKGQLITVTLVGPPPTRSLFERIKSPADTDDEPRRDPTRKPTPPGIDRYVPPERRRERERGERSEGRTQSGPRPAAAPRERGRGGKGRGERGVRGEKGGSGSGSARPKKTVEELDAEMNDYFGGNQEETAPVATTVVEEKKFDDDGDLIL